MKILLFVYLISSVSDREFILVQESWIYTYTSKPSSLDDIMSRRLATLVRDIGCNHYSCRENAIELLSRESSADSIRAFFWGSHHTNIDIAMRCRVALRRLLPCNHCNGSAICTRKNDTYSVGCS